MKNSQIEQLQDIIATSDPSLSLLPECQGGVLLKGRFYHDIIFPGASLIKGANFDCVGVQIVGQVQFTRLSHPYQLQTSRQRRIEGIQALQRISKVPSRQQRACLVVNLLCRRLGLAAALNLSPAFVAGLVSAASEEIVDAFRSYESSLSSLVGSGRLTASDRLAWQRRLYGADAS